MDENKLCTDIVGLHHTNKKVFNIRHAVSAFLSVFSTYKTSLDTRECVDCRCALTDERQRVPRAGQQVVGVEQEEGVAQDEGHLEVGAHGAFGRKQEAAEVHHDEEAAGDQQVDHVDCRAAPK